MHNIYQKLLSISAFVLLLTQSAQAQERELEQYRPLLIKNAAQLGLTKTDVQDAVILKAYTDDQTHITFIYLQQTYQKISVYNSIISATFVNNSFQYSSGTFEKNITAKGGSPIPSKTYTDAIRSASRHLGLNDAATLSITEDLFENAKTYKVAAPAIARRPIEITLYWTPSDDHRQLILTWNVNIEVKETDDWWNVRINAQTGEFVQKENLTVYEHHHMPESKNNVPVVIQKEIFHQAPLNNYSDAASLRLNNRITAVAPLLPPDVTSATYRVIRFPYESPVHTTFTDEISPWSMAGIGNNATTLGWHYDNTTNYTITRGNNVFAHLDVNANNTPDALTNWPDTSTSLAPALTFINPFGSSIRPDSSRPHKKAAVDNLFYWSNVMHDVMYKYGFNEVAGNFQASNLGRGGLGNDAVQANAQDASGSNNANFATPGDGTNPRMQMYLFDGTPSLTINSPAGIAGIYGSAESIISTTNKLRNNGPVTGEVVYYNDAVPTSHMGCTAASNAAQLNGKIALISASGCATYNIKLKNAQTAGAIAAIIYYPTNAYGAFGGTNDNSITIPAIGVGLNTANNIITQLNANVPVFITMTGDTGFDGSLDNGVIVHEYGHGVSNRLTGGGATGACLGNAEQGGEGWSDYLALMMTTNWATATTSDGPIARPMGTYALGQASNGSGIRRYPYTTNMAVNPVTYSYVAANTQVHNIGEIWCSALWDMTWNIIAQENSITPDLYNNLGTGGNSIALNLVITGMKIQPCQPGFLDARNAILVADSILYGNAHKCAIWAAFARRGMGASAIQGSSLSATDQTQAFDLPTGVDIKKSQVLTVNPGTQYNFVNETTCGCQAGSYTVRDTIPAGFTYVSSTPAGTLVDNVLTFPSTAFAAGESKTFTVRLTPPSTACAIDTVINDNRDGNTLGGFTSTGSSTWIPATAASVSGSSWFAPNLATASTAFLTSIGTAQTAAQSLSIFSFYHNYQTEKNYDGGVVEYSINGTTWIDAEPFFLSGGYNQLMDASTALTGRRGFSGNNGGFLKAMLSVGSLGITPARFRFRMETDNGVNSTGWYIDNIQRVNGCGGIMRTGVYNSSNVRVDSDVVPMFVSNNIVLPLSLLAFNAAQSGNQVSLDWNTADEINVKNFSIEWSTDAANWTPIGNVAASNQSRTSYNFLHNTPARTKNFYRIRMNDRDGPYKYSAVRMVKLDEKLTELLVLMPNFVTDNAVLYIDRSLKASQVSIFNSAGALVRQIKVAAGIRQLDISTAGLANGIYTIMAVGEEKATAKMVVQH